MRFGPKVVTVPDPPKERSRLRLGHVLGGAGSGLALVGYIIVRGGSRAFPGWAIVAAWAGLAVGALLMLLGGRIVDHLERLAWTRFCKANGWRYMHVDKARAEAWSGAVFSRGHSHVARNVVEAHIDGEWFEAWNYRFTTGYGRSSQTHDWRVLVLQMPPAAAPLSIEKETTGKKVTHPLGGQDIDFESDEFSRMFWVLCDQRHFAYDVIDARMMGFLLEVGPDHTWVWSGSRLAVATAGKMDRDHVAALMPAARAFRDHVPRIVSAGTHPGHVVTFHADAQVHERAGPQGPSPIPSSPRRAP